jgi:hypothetical protein
VLASEAVAKGVFQRFEGKSMSNKLITAYRDANAARRRVRTIVLFAILAEVAVFGGLLYSSFTSFAQEGAQAYSAAVQKKASPIVTGIVADVPKMMSRVLPVYTANLEKSFNQEMPAMQKLMLSELAKLEAYGKKQSPFLEKEMLKFVEAQEQAFIEEVQAALGGKSTPDEIEKLALDYRIALDKKFSEFMVSNVGKHIELAAEIHGYAEQLAMKPELKAVGFDPQVVLGVGLEMLGRDLQETK